MRKCFFLLIAGLISLAGPAGGSEAEYLLRGVQVPEPHAVNGLIQTVLRERDGLWRVHVSCSATPIGSHSPAPPLRPVAGVPTEFRLPQSLLLRFSAGQSAWERGTEILKWVSSELKLKTENDRPQDAESVLRRGSGRCSGVANATAALFMAAGFQARTVSGLLVGDQETIPHRWLEVALPNAGWVPTDPTLGFWVVTPRYISFGRTVELVPEIRPIRLPPEKLSFPRTDSGMYLRPDLGSKLRCRAVGNCTDELVAVLRDGVGEERRSRLSPEGVFSGLLPGRWVLEVVDGERSIRKFVVEVKADEDSSLALKIGCGGES